jgi:hypothetical protein
LKIFRVIRVWDIVDDHDKLKDRINLAIDRIELSHSRGQQSIIYSELDGSHDVSFPSSSNNVIVPRVFAMKQSIATNEVKLEKHRHFPPASHDPLQYTLLKFYELNVGAIKVLLDAKEQDVDLPFTPGPKEHEIIHYNTNPPRSILLMGRR